MKGYQENNKKWSIISESLKGRNLNSVKNRFHSILKKNGVIEPTNENIESVIQKLKKAECSINASKISSDNENNDDDEEIKFEEPPKKQLKVEKHNDIQEMYKGMLNHFQLMTEYSQYFNMANAFMGANFPNFSGLLKLQKLS